MKNVLSRLARTAVCLVPLLGAITVQAQSTGPVEFNAGGLERMALPSWNCTGFEGQPSWHCDAITVPLYLARAKDGSHTALVFIEHGSGGLDRRHSDRARFLAENNINAMIVSSWEARGIGKAQFDPNANRDKGASSASQAQDVLTVAAQLKQMPEWASARLGYIGESTAGTTARYVTQPWIAGIAYRNLGSKTRIPMLDASVGISAGCLEYNTGENFRPVPILHITGSKDSMTPVAKCKRQVEWINSHGGKAEPLVEVDGGQHDFDAPWREQYNFTAMNTSKCLMHDEGNEFVVEVNGQRFPRTAKGYNDAKATCMFKGERSGSATGDTLTGSDVWLAFFKRWLVEQPSQTVVNWTVPKT